MPDILLSAEPETQLYNTRVRQYIIQYAAVHGAQM
jgi:hypothetical protein